MNSFKKVSLIIAAALTSTMLVSTAANAATTTLTVAGSAATGGTAATAPVTLPVPSDNSVDAADALKITVSGSDITGTSITAVATNATIVPAITGTTVVTASSGSGSLVLNVGTGTSAEFYVYTKTTTVGSVAVTVGGNTTTYYVQGLAGSLNSIALVAPASGAAGTVVTVKVAGYDVFGNLKGGSTINTLVSSNGVATATALTTDTATATVGTKDQTITLPALGSVVITAYATVASAVTGLSGPVGSVVATVAVRDLAGELAAKTAELAVANAALAAEKAGRAADKVTADKAIADAAAKLATDKAAADLAKATYIAEYNALAKKWNAKNPKAKVKYKK
jgi:hypothetical protein